MELAEKGQEARDESSFEGIQILRAAAALLVMLVHTLTESLVAIASPKSPEWLTKFGGVGVDIFFVISGFIMFRVSFPAGRPVATPAAFLLKRLTRIYPFYWFWVAVILGLWSLDLVPLVQSHADMLIRSIFLLPTDYYIIAIAWTLVYEMYFYVIFGATLYFSKPLISVLGASATILILYGVGRWGPDSALRDFLSNPIAVEFCFGLILGYLLLQRPKLAIEARRFWIPGFALLGIAALAQPYAASQHPPNFARVLQWGVPALLIVASVLSLKPNSGPLRRHMVLLGDASYAIYLTHPLLLTVYARVLRGDLSNFPQWPIVPAVVGLCASFGVLIHVYAERRITRSVRHLFGGRFASASRSSSSPSEFPFR